MSNYTTKSIDRLNYKRGLAGRMQRPAALYSDTVDCITSFARAALGPVDLATRDTQGDNKTRRTVARSGAFLASYRLLVGPVAAACLCVSTSTLAAEAARHFDIRKEPLSQALTEFGSQSDLTVRAPSALTAGKAGLAVHGDMPPREALKLLLRGSGLTFTSRKDGTIAIQAAAQSIAGAGPVQAAKDGESSLSRDLTGGNNLATIVVTAEKRSEILQNVPATVNVLSSEKLQIEGIDELSDYAKQVPGLALNSNSGTGIGGGTGLGEAVIRGVSAGQDTSPVVAMYLDNVPFTSNSNQASLDSRVTLDPDLSDVDHIEILEGPQSTLYGANALGGIIKIVTKEPDLDDFGGQAEIGGAQVDGGGSGWNLRGTVNIPIVPDLVALRLSAADRENPGYIDNPVTGRTDINEESVKGTRAQLLIKISERLETNFSGYWQEINQQGPNLIDLNQFQRPLDGLTFHSRFPLAHDVKNSELGDTTTLDMGFAKLINTLSYTNTFLRGNADYSPYIQFVGAPASYGALVTYEPTSTRYNDELRLTSAPGPLEWLAGLFYTHERDTLPFDLRGADAAGAIVPASSPYYNLYTVGQLAFYKEYSAYGDITYHFTNQYEATVGARYSYDQQPFVTTETGTFTSLPFSQGTETGSSPSYLATLSYHPDAHLTYYVRIANAYRPGGVQPLPSFASALKPTFGPDTLWSYEGGVKGTFWNDRASFTADAYHMKWSDIQLTVLAAIPGGGDYTVITNAASASIDGAEASLNLTPVDRLHLGLNGNYNYGRLTSNVPSIGVSAGTALPYSQRFSGSATADYSYPINNALSGWVGLSDVYHARTSTTSLAQGGQPNPLPSYDELDVRTGFQWSRYTLTFHLDNVLNKYALTEFAPAVVYLPANGQILQPRTFRVSLLADF